jgi:hypothetical protein
MIVAIRYEGYNPISHASGSTQKRRRASTAILGFLFLEPSTWIMQTRQLSGIKRRAEREARG